MAGLANLTMVEKVKAICRADPAAKSHWRTWCDTCMGGTKDPARMDAESLERFFEDYEAGMPAAPAPSHAVALVPRSVAPPPPQQQYGSYKGGGKGGGPEQEILAEAVKTGQRASPSWKSAWVTYCTLQGNGTFDPAKHTKEFLSGYLEFLGAQGKAALEPSNGSSGLRTMSGHNGGSHRSSPMPVGGGGSWYAPPAYAASPRPSSVPPAKRPRTSGGGEERDPMVAELAERVKQLQKTDPMRKQQWSEFCDMHGGGVKDPMRHSYETLQAFLDQCLGEQSEQYGSEQWGAELNL